MSAESKKRQRRRHQNPRSNHSPQGSPQARASLSQAHLTQEIQVLKGSFSRLAVAHENNTRVFVDALQMADAQIHVMQRALNDTVRGGCDNSYRTDAGGIDFHRYMTEYWACIGFAEFVAQLKAASAQRETLILTPQEAAQENTVVFGGA